MNTHKLLSAAIVLLLLAVPLAALAQYPAFTLAGMGGGPASSTLVRTYTPTQAVTYYQQGGRGHIALVDIYGNVKETELDANIGVFDMRIVGDELYFCGSDVGATSGIGMGDGLIGHLSLADLDAGIPVVDYYKHSFLHPLQRMAAYEVGGMVKVVALGLEYDTNSPCPCPVAAGSYTCANHQLVEADFVGGALANVRYVTTTDASSPIAEELYDVVATDNYVAVIAVQRPSFELTIHRCDKGNVLGTYGRYTVYPILCDTYAPGYIGCHVKDDMVAVASFAQVSPAYHDYRTQVRVLDLPTMTMVSAQEYNLTEKTVPYEMVYIADRSTLVLLQNQELDLYGWQHAFVHLHPFSATPYHAEVHFESARHAPFVSLDKAVGDYYVSAGGEYWLLKDIATAPNPSGCYRHCKIEVRNIPIYPPTMIEIFPLIRYVTFSPSSSNSYSATTYSIICQ